MTFTLIHIILSILLITAILLQGKGGILTRKWTGESFRSKRGMEKILFISTIILAILFIISSVVTLLLA